MPVSGVCNDRFSGLSDAFNENLCSDDIGASLCVVVDGDIVVDLAGGYRDEARTQSWTHDTLVNAFSVGKGILSIVLARLQHLGAIDIDAPVRAVWPRLSAARTSEISIAEVAGHRLGLPGIVRRAAEADIYEWDAMTRHLEEQEPWWMPGTTHGYHVNTFGFLVGELIVRSSGLVPGDLLEPLRHIVGDDMFWSVPMEHLSRCAELVWSERTAHASDQDEDPSHPRPHHAYSNPPNISGTGVVNTDRWRRAVHPSTNLHATARGVAMAYEAFRLPDVIGENVQRRFTTVVSDDTDQLLGTRTRFGVGFQLPTERRSFDPHRNAFGHYGAGGSMGFHDPVRGVSVGYVMNAMGQGWQNSRNQALISALYRCL